MAKKAKKTIGKPKRKRGSKKNVSGGLLTKLIVICLAIILVAFFALKFINQTKTKEKQTTQLVEKQEFKEKEAVKTPKAEDKAQTETKKDKPSEKEQKKAEQKIAETQKVTKSIQGTWQSTTGGAFLTMNGNDYRLDFMGVDSDQPIIGTYTVDGDMITFINKTDPCKDAKGLYEVRFEKQEIAFKCKSDDCTKRRATLPTAWEWLDTEE